jgi:cell division protein ZapB
MEDELDRLEDKINRVAQLCHQLRTENMELRDRLATVSEDNKRLSARVEEARRRLKALLAQIPEGSS